MTSLMSPDEMRRAHRTKVSRRAHDLAQRVLDEVQACLGGSRDLIIGSITIDPEVDTREVITKAEDMIGEEGWQDVALAPKVGEPTRLMIMLEAP